MTTVEMLLSDAPPPSRRGETLHSAAALRRRIKPGTRLAALHACPARGGGRVIREVLWTDSAGLALSPLPGQRDPTQLAFPQRRQLLLLDHHSFAVLDEHGDVAVAYRVVVDV